MSTEIQIKCRNIWKLFGDNPKRFMKRHSGAPTPEQIAESGYIGAVQNVSFDVFKGEILIIMGLSGSGKSTLVRCITRLNDPTAGEMEYEGRDLLKVSERELIDIRRHKMGMVFQSFGLLPNRDVLENVAFPLEVQGMARDERVQRAKDMIELVGLQGRESYFPRELSGGQQQRVGIARSLAVEPDIWFLDEPFSALDPLIRAEMQDEFMRLQQKLKKTIVFNAPRERIVTVGTIMQPIDPNASGTVPKSAKIGAVAEQVLTADHPVAVVDDAGQVVGSVDRHGVTATIFRRNAAA